FGACVEARILGQAHHVSYARTLAPAEHAMATEARVGPQDDLYQRPRLAPSLDQQRQHRPSVFGRIDLRRSQIRYQQLLAAERVQRQETVLVVIAVEEARFLATVYRIISGVEVEHQLAGGGLERGDEALHEHFVQRPGCRT